MWGSMVILIWMLQDERSCMAIGTGTGCSFPACFKHLQEDFMFCSDNSTILATCCAPTQQSVLGAGVWESKKGWHGVSSPSRVGQSTAPLAMLRLKTSAKTDIPINPTEEPVMVFAMLVTGKYGIDTKCKDRIWFKGVVKYNAIWMPIYNAVKDKKSGCKIVEDVS